MAKLGGDILNQKVYLGENFSYNDIAKLVVQIQVLINSGTGELPAEKFTTPIKSSTIKDTLEEIVHHSESIMYGLEDKGYKRIKGLYNGLSINNLCKHLKETTGVEINLESLREKFKEELQL